MNRSVSKSKAGRVSDARACGMRVGLATLGIAAVLWSASVTAGPIGMDAGHGQAVAQPSIPPAKVKLPAALDVDAIKALSRPMTPSGPDPVSTAPPAPVAPAGAAPMQPLPPDQSALIERVFAPESQR